MENDGIHDEGKTENDIMFDLIVTIENIVKKTACVSRRLVDNVLEYRIQCPAKLPTVILMYDLDGNHESRKEQKSNGSFYLEETDERESTYFIPVTEHEIIIDEGVVESRPETTSPMTEKEAIQKLCEMDKKNPDREDHLEKSGVSGVVFKKELPHEDKVDGGKPQDARVEQPNVKFSTSCISENLDIALSIKMDTSNMLTCFTPEPRDDDNVSVTSESIIETVTSNDEHSEKPLQTPNSEENPVGSANIPPKSNAKKKQKKLNTDKVYHVCSFCDMFFVTLRHKLRHERIHKREARSKSCAYCSKTFSTAANRLRHERIHTGEKPFSCDFCKKTFNQFTHLQNHEKIHDVGKAYNCGYCKRIFARLDSRNEHELAHRLNLNSKRRFKPKR